MAEKHRHWLYHPILAPQGKIFDYTGECEPKPPENWKARGWVQHRGEMNMTAEQYADACIERAVKEALAQQGSDRVLLDAEHREKYGEDPHHLATNTEVANVMDNKTADGLGKVRPPKKSPIFTRNFERNK